MAKTNEAVSKIIDERFEEMCLAGHFPEVDYKVEDGCRSFLMMEYSIWRSKLATLIHKQLISAGYPLGIFSTRLRNDAYIGAAKSYARRFTPEDMRNTIERLKTWADG